MCVWASVCLSVWTQLYTKPCPQRSVYTNHLAHDRSTPKGHNTACIHGDCFASRKTSWEQSRKKRNQSTKLREQRNKHKHTLLSEGRWKPRWRMSQGREQDGRSKDDGKCCLTWISCWDPLCFLLYLHWAAQSGGTSRCVRFISTWSFIDFGNWKDMSKTLVFKNEFTTSDPFIRRINTLRQRGKGSD